MANQSHHLIPPNNYLWKSPNGRAYPGWHHQMVLHLAAYKQIVWSNPTVMDVKARLAKYSDYAMDDDSLQAVVEEYLHLNLQIRRAYRDMILNVPASKQVLVTAPPGNDGPSIDVNMFELDWESVLDPALFDYSSQSSTPPRGLFSSPQSPSGSTPATQYSEFSSKSIGRSGIEQDSPVNALRSMFDRGLKRLTPALSSSLPLTPTKVISTHTPSRPCPDRFMDRQHYQLISPIPRSDGPQLPIDRDIGRILFFSKGIHNSRQNIMTEPMAIDSKADGTRLPDPSKYVQTSKKHYTIPESEAAAFIHWFEPVIDALPDKIEGYYWYCDKCYVGEVTGENGGNIRGKCNQRRSIEKHSETVHKIMWKPVLPELDRSVVQGTDVEDGENHGLASGILRRKLFDAEVRRQRSKKAVNDGDRVDIGGPVTKVKRKGDEVRFDFADINQSKGSDRKK